MAGARPGAIHRIALENFVTYKQVELFPGPNLNLMIGPNGTGKSTFVCAIVLGLCGKTNILGRAKKIGDYVRSGCKEATIEIELYNTPGRGNIVITRNFNVENASAWSIDRKAVKEKQVAEAIASLNICVDNLCQLLPQDRVQDFAKMCPRELLRSTQLAVSDQGAVAVLDELINIKAENRTLAAKINNNTQQLTENEQSNTRLEAIIASMEEIKKIKKEIDMCEKKKVWTEYEDLKTELNDLKKDRTSAVSILKKCQEKLEPYKKTIQNLQNYNKNLELKRKKASSTISTIKTNLSDLLEASDTYLEKIDEINNDFNTKVAQQANKQRDVDLAKMTLMKMQNDRDNLIKTCGDEKSISAKMGDLHKPMQKINTELTQLRDKKTDIQYEIDSRIAPQKRLYENKLRQLNDAQSKRLESLRNFNESSYKAVLWLRENRHLFHGNVFEPMLLEINFSDPKYAKYLENTVANRDLVAFTFEHMKDMNLFLKKVRQEMGLKTVNAVCSQSNNLLYEPIVPLGNIKHLGFHTYLVDTISAPKPITNFLCKQYGIHRIPIGDDNTYQKSQNVPSDINYFYSENHRFTSKVSAYSGAKSTTTIEIRPARILGNSVDQDETDQTQNQLRILITRYESKMAEIKKITQEITEREEAQHSITDRRQKLNESLNAVRKILSDVRLQQSKVSRLENEPSFDIEKEKQLCELEIIKCVKSQCASQNEILNSLRSFQNESTVVDYLGHRIKTTYDLILQKNEEVSELKANHVVMEDTIARIDTKLSEVKSRAKEKLHEAKNATGEYLPQDPEFPFADEFSTLPYELNAIQEHLAMLRARIEWMDTADPQAAEEYEKRKRSIKTLQNDIEQMQRTSKHNEERMAVLKDSWLGPLESQIEQINHRFSEMFSQLGCAGEVKLSKEGSETDYDKYGISIMVQFRDEEKLQQLNQHVQSGGERALATALYLMALQQLSKAPFRCVDEVNQGMDPINERKMFQLLLKITTECDASSQYFLLTPKLLYGLEYSPQIKVHTIMNGPQAVKYSKWNMKRFISGA